MYNTARELLTSHCMKWFWRLLLTLLGLTGFILADQLSSSHRERLALFAPYSERETISTLDDQGRPCTAHVEIKSVDWAGILH